MINTIQMSSAPSTKPQRKNPYILSSLLNSINYIGFNTGAPDKFNGLVFFGAEKSDKHKGYHVNMKSAASLTQDQIDRILQIVNEGRETPITFERPHKVKTPEIPERAQE